MGKGRPIELPVVVVLSAAIVVAVILWRLADSPAVAAQPAREPLLVAASPPLKGPSENFGFPPVLQAKVDRLNEELDRCLIAAGAKRVRLEGRGWSYGDPDSSAFAACANEQDRINALADSEEMRAATAAVLPAVEAYAACLSSQGVPRSRETAPSTIEQIELERAHVACGGTASDAVPGG